MIPIWVILVGFFGAIIVGIFLWYLIWFRPGYCYLPIGQYELPRMNSGEDIYAPTNIFDFIKKYSRILYDLKSNYWIDVCGLDGYCYLYLQRQLIRMVGVFFLIFGIVRGGYYLISKDLRDWSIWDTTTSTINFSSDTILQEQCILIVLYTITIIVTILKMVVHFQSIFLNYYKKHNNLDLKFLQLRTLHIQGMLPEDIKGQVLKNQINEYLAEAGGKIMAITIIPNYAKLVELEIKRKELILMRRLIQADEALHKIFWIPKEYRDVEVFEAKLQKIDDEIQSETEKRFLSSGHAFICFDSLKTMKKVSEFLGLDPKKVFSFTVKNVESIRSRFIKKKSMRTSTFLKFEDEIEGLAEKYKGVELFVRQSPEPRDIIWDNLGTEIHFLRRGLLMLLALSILVFFTTPNEIFNFFNENVIDLQSYSWAYAFSETFGDLVQNFGPPLITLGINQILLLLIDFAAMYENHVYHSSFQQSIFNKATFYLIFNMLVIPGLSYNLGTSLYQIIKTSFDNPHLLFTNFYSMDSGLFFVIIIAQTALFSPMFYLLRLNELFINYLSPWVCHFKRQFIQDEEKWRKQDFFIFQYGYFAAQMVTIFFIMMVFSTTIPLILLVGLVYLFIKHIIEAFNLLVVHKDEIDSFGKLVKHTMEAIVICAFLFQIFFITNLYEKSAYISICILAVNALALLFLWIYLNKPFFYVIDLEGENNEQEVEIAPEHVDAWKKELRHPLILKGEDFEMPKVDKVVTKLKRETKKIGTMLDVASLQQLDFHDSPGRKRAPIKDSFELTETPFRKQIKESFLANY